jgi:hypothetical protein
MKYRISQLFFTIIVAAFTCVGCSGCRNLEAGGVYDEDQALYNAELSIVTSYEVIDTFVKWEETHRAALKPWPEITKAADHIRVNAKQWFATANAARDAYVGDPSEQNRDNLLKALAVIRVALTEASGYMLKTATGTK